jgi:hypothetical protein
VNIVELKAIHEKVKGWQHTFIASNTVHPVKRAKTTPKQKSDKK